MSYIKFSENQHVVNKIEELPKLPGLLVFLGCEKNNIKYLSYENLQIIKKQIVDIVNLDFYISDDCDISSDELDEEINMSVLFNPFSSIYKSNIEFALYICDNF